MYRHVRSVLGFGDKMHLTADLGDTEKWEKLAPVILVNERGGGYWTFRICSDERNEKP